MFLGLSLGLLILSRQWGFFIFPAIFFSGIWLWIKNRTTARKLIKPLISSFAIAALVGGWCYVHLYIQYGTITAFNIEANQRIPIDEAYKLIRKTRIKDMDLFREPVRPNFYYEPTPVFYSETWGDYWGYFTFIKEKGYYGDLGLGNGSEMGPYLGRVNFASILPTLILGAGWSLAVLRLLNIKKPFSIEDTGSTLFFFIATSSIVGCAIFVLNYYVLSEPTLKATYIIQFFVVLSFLGADFLEWMRLKFSPLYTFVLFLLGLVFLHNLPAFFSRHVLFPWL